MKKHNFPYVALGLGLFLMLLVIKGREIDSDGVTTIPLLSLLAISEFAFFVTASGAYIGITHMQSVGIKVVYMTSTILCILLSVRFMFLGIDLWPL